MMAFHNDLKNSCRNFINHIKFFLYIHLNNHFTSMLSNIFLNDRPAGVVEVEEAKFVYMPVLANRCSISRH